MVRYNYFSVSLINNGTLICEKKPGTFLKSGYTPVLGNIGLGRAFLDERQRLVRRVSNHVSNRMGAHGSFFIYGQPTFLLHYRIHGFLTGGIVNLGIVSKFIFYLRLMRTKLSANVFKETIATSATL